MSTKRRPLGNYGLSILLAVMFLTSRAGQFFAQLSEGKNEALQHGQAFQWSDFWPRFWQATFENWQSEFLQLLTFVVLTAFLIHKGSAESKDSDEEMHERLDRIERHLEEMRGKADPASSLSAAVAELAHAPTARAGP